jgi:hypothetical protein
VSVATARVPPPPSRALPPPSRAPPPLPFSAAAAHRCRHARTYARCAYSFAAAASCVKLGVRARHKGAAPPSAFCARTSPLRVRATVAVTRAAAIPRAAACIRTATTSVLRDRCAQPAARSNVRTLCALFCRRRMLRHVPMLHRQALGRRAAERFGKRAPPQSARRRRACAVAVAECRRRTRAVAAASVPP